MLVDHINPGEKGEGQEPLNEGACSLYPHVEEHGTILPSYLKGC